jgi:hypothetical protein
MSNVSPDELQYLRLCGHCYGLYETGRPDGLNQPCRCRPGGGERWLGFDFNERVSLGLCRGLEALASGSRYAPFSCLTCQDLAIGVSRNLERLALPGDVRLSECLDAPADLRADGRAVMH